ncbi:MAG: type II toxin-antitoxin system VapC family toxin [Patescibacteria group bacterium]
MAENKSLFVVDASVLLKWYLKEENDQEPALQLQTDYHYDKISLAIPHYAWSEVLNTLGRKKSFDEVLAYFSRYLAFEIQEYSITLEIAAVAIELMEKFPNITFYDAGYHALALQEGGTFVTADEKYFQKTKKHGGIMLLKDYGKKR